MQAYLIDPNAGRVTAVEHNGDYKEIYQFIEADCFDAARFGGDGDAVFVDDNGLLKGSERFFYVHGYPGLLAGKGLVLGCDAEGDSIAPKCTLEWLREHVGFVHVIGNLVACLKPRDREAEEQLKTLVAYMFIDQRKAMDHVRH